MVTSKSICFIGAGLEGGGMEKAFTSLANYYSTNGMQVSVILLFKRKHFFTLNSKVRLFEPSLNRATTNKYLYAIRLIPYLRSNIKSINPDVVISYGEWFNPFVILSTRFLKYPIFITDRMSPDLKFGFLLDLAKKILYRRATGIIAQTNFAASIIKNRTKSSNIRVIPNPLTMLDYPLVDKVNSVISVGRLSREKGHIFLIKAFSLIKDHSWTLDIVGDGSERPFLEQTVNELGLHERVKFHGHLKDFRSLLSQAKIFVLPSLSEGYPNALIEAMSVPLACISSDCVAGPADIITHLENGLLTTPRDVTELSAALQLLMNDNILRESIAKKSLEVRYKLEFSKIANEYLNFLYFKK